MAVTVTDVVTLTKIRAKVQVSEAISDSDITELANEALVEHNPTFAYTDLPDVEKEPVVLLTWIRICYVRANKAAQETNLSGPSGYGQDRSTPYNKIMSLADRLRQQYVALCSKLGINAANENLSISVSKLIVPPNPSIGSLPVYFDGQRPPAPKLSFVATGSSSLSAILGWTIDDDFDIFSAFVLLTSLGSAEPIYQDWNIQSQSTVPRTSNLASVIGTFYQMDIRSVKVTDVDRSVTQRFLLAVRSTAYFWSYSNEVIVPIFV